MRRVFAEDAPKEDAPKAEEKKEEKPKVDKKAVPGGKMMPGQKGRPLGIVSYSKLPQFRDSKGEPIPEFKVAPLGVLDPKIARPQFNK